MTENSELIYLLEKFSKSRVLVIGDVILDRYISGKVERISPEAPIPILQVLHEDTMLGGAGNVVRNLAALGADTTCISIVGDDLAGAEIKNLLSKTERVKIKLIKDSEYSTSIKVRYLSGNQQIMRADWESPARSMVSSGKLIIKKAVSAMEDCDVVILSDYGKGVLGDGRSKILIDAAHTAGLTILVDPKNKDYSAYCNADVLTPNCKELAEASNTTITSDSQLQGNSKALQKAFGIGAFLVTQGPKGMTLIDETATPTYFPAVAREVYDVSGAGDTVIAAVSAGIGAGLDLNSAARIANIAAGIVVGKAGTGVVRVDDIVSVLHQRDIGDAEAKVVSWEKAREHVEIWRRQNLKIGFANGCFDLLHPGHVSLLIEAYSACDRLIIGLNSDISVKRLKGKGRPIQPEAARATVLASLATVDSVVVFHQDTPIDLIKLLRPDILFKGADYKLDEVVGGDLVASWGGKVTLISLNKGYSTTNTLRKMGSK